MTQSHSIDIEAESIDAARQLVASKVAALTSVERATVRETVLSTGAEKTATFVGRTSAEAYAKFLAEVPKWAAVREKSTIQAAMTQPEEVVASSLDEARALANARQSPGWQAQDVEVIQPPKTGFLGFGNKSPGIYRFSSVRAPRIEVKYYAAIIRLEWLSS